MENEFKYSKNYIDLLKKMVNEDPEKRHSLKACFNILESISDW